MIKAADYVWEKVYVSSYTQKITSWKKQLNSYVNVDMVSLQFILLYSYCLKFYMYN